MTDSDRDPREGTLWYYIGAGAPPTNCYEPGSIVVVTNHLPFTMVHFKFLTGSCTNIEEARQDSKRGTHQHMLNRGSFLQFFREIPTASTRARCLLLTLLTDA